MTTPYATVAAVKAYLDVTNADDDDLLLVHLNAATVAIETFTRRQFIALGDTTRYFDSCADTDYLTLFFDEDICSITSITNGDSTTVTTAQYVTEPRNSMPYYAVKLKSSYSLRWEDDDNGDSENAITVVGRWAYSTEPPDDIEQACIRLASYYYRQKDAQVFDVTATPELGQITIPQGMPADVRMMLRPYIRV